MPRENHTGSPGTLYQRNWAFIDGTLQRRLAQMAIFTAGTGLGSVIATLAARTGFQRFILADGDRAEVSNLNRQAFTRADLDQNKAIATANIIWSLVPDAQVEVVPRFLDTAACLPLIERSDIIVNTIDLDDPTFMALNRAARVAGKTVLFPMNLGWGGILIVFAPDSLSLDEFVGIIPEQEGTQALATQLILRVLERMRTMPGGVPPYLAELLPRFKERTSSSWPYDPQLGIAAHLSSALTVRAMVALAAGQPLCTAPDFAWCDAAGALAPAAVAPVAAAARQPEGIGPHGTARQRPASDSATYQDPVADLSIRFSAPMDDPLPTPALERAADSTYAQLFVSEEGERRRRYTMTRRAHSGLVIVTAFHSALRPHEREAIGRYRLEQYVLAGLYDRAVVARLHLRTDPVVATMADNDIHVAVGDTQGQFLAYMAFQSPLPPPVSAPPGSVPLGSLPRDERSANSPRMRDLDRLPFPVESEYGKQLYGLHPHIGELPVASVRELTRLVRNQRLRTPAARWAVIEAISAVAKVMLNPAYRIRAIIGCASPEVRRLLWGFGVPLAYAPLASIQGENLSGQTHEHELLWTPEAHVPGRFWPFSLASADVRAERSYYVAMDTALSQPLGDIRAHLKRLRSGGPRLRSRYAVPSERAAGVEWVVNAFHTGDRPMAGMAHAAPGSLAQLHPMAAGVAART